MRPRLALVPGEPAGVGPELVARALQQDWGADLTVFGCMAGLRQAAASLGLALPAGLSYVDLPLALAATPGTPDPRNAPAVLEALTRAGRACLAGELDGLVTGPVHKASMSDGLGAPYTGTTELLAGQAAVPVVMMLATPRMRVALLTTHLPLRAVADAVTGEALERVLRIVHRALRQDFGIADPVIAVLGLNPHAGEDGLLGHEERDIMQPVLGLLRGEGMRLEGPLPADTAFLPARLAGVDAVLAIYHDQGLPVLKHSDFANAVNMTLGLPYPRVAVDHGTALDLAGRGMADPSSLQAAIGTCARIARTRAGA
jgi:4-hydroxythreonine-4-phosphate dehydrogenase